MRTEKNKYEGPIAYIAGKVYTSKTRKKPTVDLDYNVIIVDEQNNQDHVWNTQSEEFKRHFVRGTSYKGQPIPVYKYICIKSVIMDDKSQEFTEGRTYDFEFNNNRESMWTKNDSGECHNWEVMTDEFTSHFVLESEFKNAPELMVPTIL